MAIRDNRSNQVVNLVHNAAISTDTGTNTASVDTADYDMGVFFALAALAYTDGTYTLSLEDSPDDSAWTAVAAEKLIGSAEVSAATAASGDDMPRLGAFSTDRYLRAVITSTSTATGATIAVVTVMAGEYNPQA